MGARYRIPIPQDSVESGIVAGYWNLAMYVSPFHYNSACFRAGQESGKMREGEGGRREQLISLLPTSYYVEKYERMIIEGCGEEGENRNVRISGTKKSLANCIFIEFSK